MFTVFPSQLLKFSSLFVFLYSAYSRSTEVKTDVDWRGMNVEIFHLLYNHFLCAFPSIFHLLVCSSGELWLFGRWLRVVSVWRAGLKSRAANMCGWSWCIYLFSNCTTQHSSLSSVRQLCERMFHDETARKSEFIQAKNTTLMKIN